MYRHCLQLHALINKQFFLKKSCLSKVMYLFGVVLNTSLKVIMFSLKPKSSNSSSYNYLIKISTKHLKKYHCWSIGPLILELIMFFASMIHFASTLNITNSKANYIVFNSFASLDLLLSVYSYLFFFKQRWS